MGSVGQDKCVCVRAILYISLHLIKTCLWTKMCELYVKSELGEGLCLLHIIHEQTKCKYCNVLKCLGFGAYKYEHSLNDSARSCPTVMMFLLLQECA